MITWDPRKQKFTWTDRSNFLPDTRIQVQEFQHRIAALPETRAKRKAEDQDVGSIVVRLNQFP